MEIRQVRKAVKAVKVTFYLIFHGFDVYIMSYVQPVLVRYWRFVTALRFASRRTRVQVPFETKRRQSFPEANHVVFVPKLHQSKARQDKTRKTQACVRRPRTPKGTLPV